ncbi:MAG: winged helix DNA-binding protein [Methanocella sp.]|jgi:predicted transcriptional regulator
MKHAEITVLDEKEEEFVKLLEEFGLSRSMARIIVCLAVHDECTSREIEIVTGIKSSTVSIILKKLREDRIVKGEKKVDKPHDRGVMHYSLAGSMDDVLSILEEKKRKETSAYIDRIKKIKNRLK